MLFFLDYDDGAGGTFGNSPGLLPLIGHTRRQGFDVDFVSRPEELLAAVGQPDVDVVGFSSMERLLPRSIPLAREVRELRPDLVLMIGGNSLEPFAVDLAAGLFDIVVLGEAEHLLPALLRALALSRGRDPGRDVHPEILLAGSAGQVAAVDPGGALTPASVEHLLQATFPRRIQGESYAAVGVGNVLLRDPARGVVWKVASPGPEAASALPVATDPAPRQEELDDLCVMPWDLFEGQSWRSMELYAQRGCRWGRCDFCCVSDAEIRSLSPAKVVAIIEEAAARGVELVSFADNLFVQHPAWNRELLDLLIARRPRVSLKAQTRAARNVWPLLPRMREAGFTELAFGLETVSPERAEFMAKSFNGRAYVEQARATVLRTAAAGIYPVVYLIMADPTSTLLGIAEEATAVIDLLTDVYRRTGSVPMPSYSLAMLPVAGTRLTGRLPHGRSRLDLGRRTLEVPAMFRFSPEVSEFLNRIGEQTRDLPSRRENLAAFPIYFETAAAVARDRKTPDLEAVAEAACRGLEAVRTLIAELERDVEASARAFAAGLKREGDGGFDPVLIDGRRLGGYVDGTRRLQRLLRQVVAGLKSGRSTTLPEELPA
jgi:radical SAM superfamily enzyme YgiQ (UPF0313 family)